MTEITSAHVSDRSEEMRQHLDSQMGVISPTETKASPVDIFDLQSQIEIMDEGSVPWQNKVREMRIIEVQSALFVQQYFPKDKQIEALSRLTGEIDILATAAIEKSPYPTGLDDEVFQEEIDRMRRRKEMYQSLDKADNGETLQLIGEMIRNSGIDHETIYQRTGNHTLPNTPGIQFYTTTERFFVPTDTDTNSTLNIVEAKRKERPRNKSRRGLAAPLLALATAACTLNTTDIQPAPTIAPTNTPIPTVTLNRMIMQDIPTPTSSAIPTVTDLPIPETTPVPTNTPEATATLEASQTNTPQRIVIQITNTPEVAARIESTATNTLPPVIIVPPSPTFNLPTLTPTPTSTSGTPMNRGAMEEWENAEKPSAQREILDYIFNKFYLGTKLSNDQLDTLGEWINAQPEIFLDKMESGQPYQPINPASLAIFREITFLSPREIDTFFEENNSDLAFDVKSGGYTPTPDLSATPISTGVPGSFVAVSYSSDTEGRVFSVDATPHPTEDSARISVLEANILELNITKVNGVILINGFEIQGAILLDASYHNDYARILVVYYPDASGDTQSMYFIKRGSGGQQSQPSQTQTPTATVTIPYGPMTNVPNATSTQIPINRTSTPIIIPNTATSIGPGVTGAPSTSTSVPVYSTSTPITP